MNVDCLNAFSFDLFRILCKDSKENEFVSPFSVLTALNMTLVGAKNKTEKELFEGLRYSLGFTNSDEVHSFFKNFLNECEKSDSCNLNIANRVLIHKASDFRVNPEYAQRLLDVYKAEVNEANFEKENKEILKTCNEWVNEKTNGKIPSILEQLDSSARAVLLNAIYFKGMWQKPFDEKHTEDLPFYNFGNKDLVKNVPTMQKVNNVQCSLFSCEVNGEEVQMLEIPYNGSIAMNILMTKSIDGLEKVEPHLNYEIFEKMKFVAREVSKLCLPKFKVETKYKLVDSLIEMGVKEPFSNTADFSGITEDYAFKISEVIHKAAVEVNEEGTIAAAATAIMMVGCCATSVIIPMQEFIVDHPFVYIIRDTYSGVILFAGRVNEL